MQNRLSLLTVISLISATACSAELVISDGEKPVKGGVPFRIAEPWVAGGVLTTHSKGETCDPETRFVEHINLPGDQLYYANVHIRSFAKSEFSVTLNEDGTLKQISSNSESQFKDTAEGIKAFSEALTNLGVAAKGAEALTTKPCDSGREYRKIVRQSEWLKDPKILLKP